MVFTSFLYQVVYTLAVHQYRYPRNMKRTRHSRNVEKTQKPSLSEAFLSAFINAMLWRGFDIRKGSWRTEAFALRRLFISELAMPESCERNSPSSSFRFSLSRDLEHQRQPPEAAYLATAFSFVWTDFGKLPRKIRFVLFRIQPPNVCYALCVSLTRRLHLCSRIFCISELFVFYFPKFVCRHSCTTELRASGRLQSISNTSVKAYENLFYNLGCLHRKIKNGDSLRKKRLWELLDSNENSEPRQKS